MTTLWLIEDNPAYRRATERALRQADGKRAIYAFASCEEALAAPATTASPEVILLDVGLPGMDGITGIARLKQRAPEASILVLTVFEDDDKIFRAICSGASGYLLKSEPMPRILEAIAEAQAGGSPMNSRIARRVLSMFARFAPVKKDYGLTPRETDVLQLMVEGTPKKQIADRLALNPHTVDYA
ncbi:MAG: response regulator transcription factor, partial [Verrucomicrobia bacterium]|nr:response regulator transcription factor [Verrucomicrobiota bacterium]